MPSNLLLGFIGPYWPFWGSIRSICTLSHTTEPEVTWGWWCSGLPASGGRTSRSSRQPTSGSRTSSTSWSRCTTGSQVFSLCLPPSTHVMLTQDRAAGGGGEDGLHSLHREGAGGGRLEDKQRHPVQAAAPLQQRWAEHIKWIVKINSQEEEWIYSIIIANCCNYPSFHFTCLFFQTNLFRGI